MPSPRWLRALQAAIGAIAGVALVAFAMSRLAPYSQPDHVQQKLAYYSAHADEFDALFFGSSNVQRGVSPEVFDRALAGRGTRIRSFNFSAVGMGGHESNALIRRVLGTHPERLQWVFVELSHWNPLLLAENRFKARIIHWHDLPETRSALRSTLSRVPWPDAGELVLSHLLHFAANALSVSRGPAALAAGGWEPDPRLGSRRGFEPFTAAEYERGRTFEARERFLESPAQFRVDVAKLPVANEMPAAREVYNRRALEDQIAMIERAGAQPVFLIPPTIHPSPELHALIRAGDVEAPVFAFDDPVAYPALYDPDVRFDRVHLNTVGAALFTEALADRFSDWLAER